MHKYTLVLGKAGGGESGLKSAFNLSSSYHRLPVGFACVLRAALRPVNLHFSVCNKKRSVLSLNDDCLANGYMSAISFSTTLSRTMSNIGNCFAS